MKTALVLALALMACGDPGRTQEVLPRAEDPKITGANAYQAALSAFGRFDDHAAVAKLKLALTANPGHFRAVATGLLFNLSGLPVAELLKRANVLLLDKTASSQADPSARVLLQAAVAFQNSGAEVAAATLRSEQAVPDHELAFWRLNLAYHAGHYALANRGLYQLLQSESTALRGRIYDLYVRVLLHFGATTEAVAIASQYRDLLPKRVEAARLMVRALIAANDVDAATQALKRVEAIQVDDRSAALHGRLAAQRGRFAAAAEHYATAIDKAPKTRRYSYAPAQGLLLHLAGLAKQSRAVIAQCRSRQGDSPTKQLCEWLAGMTDAKLTAKTGGSLAAHLTALTQTGEHSVGALSGMLRASAQLGGVGCLRPVSTKGIVTTTPMETLNLLPLLRKGHFFATEEVPLYQMLVACHRASLIAVTDAHRAASGLKSLAETQPLLLPVMARIQARFDTAKALLTIQGFAERLPQLDKTAIFAGWADDLHKRLQKLNTQPKPSN